jgi:S1-C subfamily serine protease
MNIIDLIILLTGAIMAYRWYKAGLARNLFAVGGLLLGIIVGLLIAPSIMAWFIDPIGKYAAVVLCVCICTFALGSLGELIGNKLNIRLSSKTSQKINAYAGSFGSIIFLLIFVWLSAAIIISSPFSRFNNLIQNSAIVQLLNSRLPPTPPIIERIDGLVKPLDFPQVFAGIPQKLADPVAPAGSEVVRLAVLNAGQSVVKIESRGCGNNISSGSGFIVGDGLVMTNSHVVAGSDANRVIDTSGSYASEVIYYDPSVDIAILKTPKLKAKALGISSQKYSRGQEAVVMGFPSGGKFVAEAAGVTNTLVARGFDIYNKEQVDRVVYEFVGKVVQGNSGGPLVLSDGTVIGMVFASSQNNEGYGYALTGEEISQALSAAGKSRVDTQACYQ